MPTTPHMHSAQVEAPSQPAAARGLGRTLAMAGLALCAFAAASGSALAQPQAWPSKPIRLVVGFPPGGSSDATARMLATALSAKLGQQVFVENKAGANSIIATQFVRSQPADGYTLLSVSSSSAINQRCKSSTTTSTTTSRPWRCLSPHP